MSASARAARVLAMRAIFAELCNPGGSDSPPSPDAFAELTDDDDDAGSGDSGESGGDSGGNNIPEKTPAPKMKLARDIVATFAERRDDIRRMASASATYEFADITATERALIYAGAAEMLARPKAPAAMVINETLEIAKQYGTEGGEKLVNAILDGIAKHLKTNSRRSGVEPPTGTIHPRNKHRAQAPELNQPNAGASESSVPASERRDE